MSSVKIITKIRLPWLLFTLGVFFALIKLGLWQLDRAAEKTQRLAHIEKMKSHDALSLTQIMQLLKRPHKNLAEAINDLPIQITGNFDPKAIFLLDNQVNKNALGYRVFQVVHTNKLALLVNLGWVNGSINRNILPTFKPLLGKHSFSGHVRLMEKGIVLQDQKFTTVRWPLRVQQIELTKFSALIGEKLLPFVVYLNKNDPLGFVKNWHPVVMPPAKHQAYAFQWFGLAIVWLILMIKYALKTPTKNDDSTTNNNKG